MRLPVSVWPSFAIVAVLVTSVGAVAAPDPTASPIAAPAPACTVAPGVSPIEAFSTPIDDPTTLRFIQFVQNRPQPVHRGIEKRADGRSKTDDAAIDAATADTCLQLAVRRRSARLLYAVQQRWGDDAVTANLEAAATFAIGALAVRDAIPPLTLERALAVFGADPAGLRTDDARTASPAAQACATSKTAAKVTFIPPLIYPPVAIAQRATGTVLIKISLDLLGRVQSAAVFRRSVPDGDGGDALVNAAIETAGSSDYAPATIACQPQTGVYLFHATFQPR